MTEQWLAIANFPGYEVSDLGRVRSFRRRLPSILKSLIVYGTGYVAVSMTSPRGPLGRRIGIRRNIHRLVLEAFVGPCPIGHQAAHLNGIRTDPRLVNMAWVTVRENNLDHKYAHGTMPHGESSVQSKLTRSQVEDIRSKYSTKETTQRKLARLYGVHHGTIQAIVERRSWKATAI